MKTEIAIPFLCSATVATMSLLFYGFLATEFATTTVANLIVVTAISGIVQISFVPQAWIYVFTADNGDERRRRLTIAAILEWCGTVSGLFVAVVLAVWCGWGNSLVWAYLAFCLMGCTSVQGYLRGEHSWAAYAACITLPSVTRVFLVLLLPFGRVPFPVSLEEVVIQYLLLPELVRYAIFAATILAPKWKWASFGLAKEAARHIYRNWTYDVGTAIVDVGDKYIFSLILSPTLLVVYFFARKVSAAATILLEPFYAYRFKRFYQNKRSELSRVMSGLTLLSGYAVAVLIGLSMMLVLPIMSKTSLLGINIIPSLITDNMQIFVSCTLIDACIAANRWGRYLSLLDGAVLSLLGFRICCFGLFAAIVFALTSLSETRALIIGFLIFMLADVSYPVRQIARMNALESYAWKPVGRATLEA